MTIQELKEKFDSIYGFDLADRSRKREMVEARRIYCKIGYSLGYTLRQIGETIDRKHCNVIHLLDTVYQVTETHKAIHDDLVKEFGFITNKFNVRKLKELQLKASVKTNKEILELIEEINNTIIKWDTNSLNNFLETRVKPYNKLIKATMPQKEIEEVKGAKLNRPVKNPVLC
jgi:hypothetical protein